MYNFYSVWFPFSFWMKIFIFSPQNLGAVSCFSLWSRRWVLRLLIFSFVLGPLACRYWRHLPISVSYLFYSQKDCFMVLENMWKPFFLSVMRSLPGELLEKLVEKMFLETVGMESQPRPPSRSQRWNGRSESWIRRMERVQREKRRIIKCKKFQQSRAMQEIGKRAEEEEEERKKVGVLPKLVAPSPFWGRVNSL